MLPVAVARSPVCGDAAIRQVLPVLWMTSYFPMIGSEAACCYRSSIDAGFCVRADTPAARYWLRPVLDVGAPGLDESFVYRGAEGGECYAQLPCYNPKSLCSGDLVVEFDAEYSYRVGGRRLRRQ